VEISSNSSGDKEGISCELPNFDLQFFDEPPAKSKRLANLSEPELSRLVEQRQSEKTKNQQTGLCFNVKTVSPTYLAHFLVQDFSHFLRVFLVGVLLFAP